MTSNSSTNQNLTLQAQENNWDIISDLFDVSDTKLNEIIRGKEAPITPEAAPQPIPQPALQSPAYLGSAINLLIVEGCFTVTAASPIGTYFQNLSKQSRKVRFKALASDYAFKEHSQTSKDTEGYLPPQSSIRYLVIQQFNNHENIEDFSRSNEIDLLLKPMETIGVICNGKQDGYHNNQGNIVVEWSLQS